MAHWLGDIYIDDSNQAWDTKLVPEGPKKWMALPIKVDISKIEQKEEIIRTPRMEKMKRLTAARARRQVKPRKQRMLVTIKPKRGRPPKNEM